MSDVLKKHFEEGYSLVELSKLAVYKGLVAIHISKKIRDKFVDRKMFILEKEGKYIIVSEE